MAESVESKVVLQVGLEPTKACAERLRVFSDCRSGHWSVLVDAEGLEPPMRLAPTELKVPLLRRSVKHPERRLSASIMFCFLLSGSAQKV
jgi:hypothetical protein